MKPRLRFAPSPTGYLHIGGARSALYNWLWARKTGGTFVLRIEDTDRKRSTEESVQAIFDALTWLGLDWDEGPGKGGDHGPYFQTERLELYRRHADALVESGHAYRCYATKEQLAEAREAFQKEHGRQGFKYPGWWRDKGPSDWPDDQPFVYRIKVPKEGATGWDDLVKGRIEIGHSEMQDEVLLRSDGVPLYNFGCVVDDLEMGITLVARGDDHMINTPVQILLYQAMGAEPPQFAHMPMILDNMREAGISAELLWFIGFPTQTRRDVFETAKYLYERRDKFGLSSFVGSYALHPDSVVFERPQDFKIKLIAEDNSQYTYESEEGLAMNEIQELKDMFSKHDNRTLTCNGSHLPHLAITERNTEGIGNPLIISDELVNYCK